jgi:hypothetical protein
MALISAAGAALKDREGIVGQRREDFPAQDRPLDRPRDEEGGRRLPLGHGLAGGDQVHEIGHRPDVVRGGLHRDEDAVGDLQRGGDHPLELRRPA